MKTMLIGFIAMISFNVFADTKVLLFDDLETNAASFYFNKANNGQVIITAEFESSDCYDVESSGSCINRINTKALPNLKSEGRDVYYVGEGKRIYCGQTQNLFGRDYQTGDCYFEVKAEKVCTTWFSTNDCVEVSTKHRAFMFIKE